MGDGWKPPQDLVVLSGGNPQVPKGEGPVRYFITHMPWWQRVVGERLDALITKAVPKVEKAVRWNSPFYGAGQGWFLSVHCFQKYVKVTFFAGASLEPVPPEASKDPNVRNLHVTDADGLDEKRFIAWVKQASKLPGWNGS